MICNIRYSSFANLVGLESGGAINVTSNEYKITNNEFVNCSANQTGGAIYAVGCTIESKCCIFNRCFVQTHLNDHWGNAFRIDSSKLVIDSLNVHQCGIDNEKSGDSATSVQYSHLEIKNINYSSNYGDNGASMISVIYISQDSNARYLNGVDGHDHNLIEAKHQPMTFQYCNMIDGSKSKYMFYCLNTTLTFENCVFQNSHKVLNLVDGTIILTNCTSDIKYSGYIFINKNLNPIYP